MGKSTISMAIFNSYVSLPEGISSTTGSFSCQCQALSQTCAKGNHQDLHVRWATRQSIKRLAKYASGFEGFNKKLGFHMISSEYGYDVVKGSLILFRFCLEMGIHIYIYLENHIKTNISVHMGLDIFFVRYVSFPNTAMSGCNPST